MNSLLVPVAVKYGRERYKNSGSDAFIFVPQGDERPFIRKLRYPVLAKVGCALNPGQEGYYTTYIYLVPEHTILEVYFATVSHTHPDKAGALLLEVDAVSPPAAWAGFPHVVHHGVIAGRLKAFMRERALERGFTEQYRRYYAKAGGIRSITISETEKMLEIDDLQQALERIYAD